jgi:hypothetical protein
MRPPKNAFQISKSANLGWFRSERSMVILDNAWRGFRFAASLCSTKAILAICAIFPSPQGVVVRPKQQYIEIHLVGSTQRKEA